MNLKVVCAWCQRVMLASQEIDCSLVSHGICEECSKKVLREMEISKLESMWRAS